MIRIAVNLGSGCDVSNTRHITLPQSVTWRFLFNQYF